MIFMATWVSDWRLPIFEVRPDFIEGKLLGQNNLPREIKRDKPVWNVSLTHTRFLKPPKASKSMSKSRDDGEMKLF